MFAVYRSSDAFRDRHVPEWRGSLAALCSLVAAQHIPEIKRRARRARSWCAQELPFGIRLKPDANMFGKDDIFGSVIAWDGGR